MACWHIPFYDNHLKYLNAKYRGRLIFKPLGSRQDKTIKEKSVPFPPVAMKMPEKLVQQFTLKRCSPNTIKTYTSVFARYLEYCHESCVDPDDPLSVKFYFKNVLEKELETSHVQRPRKEKKLPEVFSEEEVVLLLKQPKNLKHKTILYTIYSAGLRRSEVLNLKIHDIDSQRNCIVIREGKGKKDRMTLLSKKNLFF